MQRVKVEIDRLKAGMYVAQLDRPWLETPFMFQGFELKQPDEVALLGKYCRHVYVDIARSSLAPGEIKKILKSQQCTQINELPKADLPKICWKTRIFQWFSKFDPTGKLAKKADGVKTYPVRRPMKKEMPDAVKAYGTVIDTVDNVLNRVRDGGVVDAEEVRESISPMIDSVLRNPGAMSWFVLLKKRDSYSYNHSIASSVWATVLGRHLGFDRPTLDNLAVGAMLLDIGKARLPTELLNSTAILSDSEMGLVRQHVSIGAEIAKGFKGVGREVLDMIESHHERHDGSGYPRGLAGTDIPVYGRIAGLVDCYDAMTSNRSYAKAKSSYDAIRDLNSLAGKHFQKELVEQFVQALGMFPTGSVVELNSGEIGIVVEQNRVRRLRPKVMLLLDRNKQPIKKHRILDLRKCPSKASEKKAVWIASGHEPGAFGIDPSHYFIG